MHLNANAPRGEYQLKAKFFGHEQNRVSTRNKIYLTFIHGFGTNAKTVSRKAFELQKSEEVVPVMTLAVK